MREAALIRQLEQGSLVGAMEVIEEHRKEVSAGHFLHSPDNTRPGAEPLHQRGRAGIRLEAEKYAKTIFWIFSLAPLMTITNYTTSPGRNTTVFFEFSKNRVKGWPETISGPKMARIDRFSRVARERPEIPMVPPENGV